MAEYSLIKTCYHCKGEGVVPDYPDGTGGPPSGTETCTVCNGNTYVIVYSFSEDFIDFFADMMDKINDIKEKVDEL